MFIPKPTYRIKGNITLLDIDQLKKDGLEAIIFDLDSTIMEPRSASLKPEVVELLDRLKPDFKLGILTNNKNEAYLEKVKLAIDIPIITHARKPSNSGFINFQEVFNVNPEKILVIGDRPIPDILGGHLAKMKTCLVEPLQSEPYWIKLIRKLEHALLK